MVLNHLRRRNEYGIHVQEFLRFLTLILTDNGEIGGMEKYKGVLLVGPTHRERMGSWPLQDSTSPPRAYEGKVVIMKRIHT